MRVGAAQIDITPDREVMLAGSFEIRKTAKVLSPLYAGAVAIDDGMSQLVFVSLDLLFLSDSIMAELRKGIAQAADILPEQVIISCTHTHNAQGLFECLPPLPVDEELATWTKAQIVLAARQALENRRDANMGYARGEAPCSFNRRCILENGKVWMSPGPQDPPVTSCEGPHDQEYQVVWFETSAGEPIAVMVNYAAHPTLAFGCPQISADFPGEIKATVQQALGGDLPVLYLQGACGNTSPIDFASQQGDVDRLALMRETGKRVGNGILAAMTDERGQMEGEATLSHACSSFMVQARHPGVEDLSLGDARDYVADNRLDVIDHYDAGAMFNYYFADSVAKLEGARPFQSDYRVEVSVYRLGEIIIAVNPAELFVEYQLEMKAKSPYPKTMVAELTNGYCGYVLTERALKNGSYEARLGRSSYLDASAGEEIVKKTLKLIDELVNTQP